VTGYGSRIASGIDFMLGVARACKVCRAAVAHPMLAMAGAFGALYGLAAVFPDIFGWWFDNGFGFAFMVLSVYDAKAGGVSDDIARRMPRFARHLDIERIGVQRFANYLEHLRISGRSLTEIADALDEMGPIGGFRGAMTRLTRDVSQNAFSHADDALAEVLHARWLKDRGYTIHGISRQFNFPDGSSVEFDSFGRTPSGEWFVGNAKNIRRASLDLPDFDMDTWLGNHVTGEMRHFREGLDALGTADPLHGAGRVVYSLPEDVFTDPRFHQRFLEAVTRAEAAYGFQIEVVPVPP